MAPSYAKTILDRRKEERKPRGFRKSGQTFLRPLNDGGPIVTLQASPFGFTESGAG